MSVTIGASAILFGAKIVVGVAKAYVKSQSNGDSSDFLKNLSDKVGDVIGDQISSKESVDWAARVCKKLLRGKSPEDAEIISGLADCIWQLQNEHLGLVVYSLRRGVRHSRQTFLSMSWVATRQFREAQGYSNERHIHELFDEVAGQLYDEALNSNDLDLELKAKTLNGVLENGDKMEYIIAMLEEIYAQKKDSDHFIDTENEVEDFQAKYFEPLFLEQVGNYPVSLMDVYQKPHYYGESINIDKRLMDCITCKDIDYYHKMLVVLGQPGGGKSSLMSYLLSEQRFMKLLTKQERKARIFHFSKLDIDWNDIPVDRLPNELLSLFGLGKQTSKLSNTLLILDGFDEIQMNSERRTQFLNKLYTAWCSTSIVKNFNLIITCRVNCFEKCRCPTIILQPMNVDQICNYADTYWNRKHRGIDKKTLVNLTQNNLSQITGIPIILYLILALNIFVYEGMTEDSVYDEVFSVDGQNSIYHRANYDEQHRISDSALAIHEFSKQIALCIWDKNPDGETITRREYEAIEERVIASNICHTIHKGDSLIGQFFQCKYVETIGTYELRFVHRTIYEYFVARAFYDCVRSFDNTDTPEQLWEGTEQLAGFANILGIKSLDDYPNIMKYFLRQLNKDAGKHSNNWWRKFMDVFLVAGLMDFANQRKHGGLVGIKEETLRFLNLIQIIREIKKEKGEHPPFRIWSTHGSNITIMIDGEMLKGVPRLKSSEFIRLLSVSSKKIDFSDMDLRGVELQRTDLREAVFRGADLRNVNLSRADLCRADLSEAKLNNAVLSEASLNEANLKKVNLSKADLSKAELSGAELFGAVLEETKLYRARVCGSNLTRVFAFGADLTETDLSESTLSQAVLHEALFDKTNLYRTKLRDADLCGAFIRKEQIIHAEFSEKDLERWNDSRYAPTWSMPGWWSHYL